MQKRASAALLAALLSTTNGLAGTHTVKRGDTLSQIAADKVSRPVYGKSGSLQKILTLNPDIRDPNRIQVNQIIRVGEEPSAPVADVPQPVAETPLAVSEASSVPSVMENESVSKPSRKGSFELSLAGVLSSTRFDVDADDNTFAATPKSKVNKGLDLGLGYYVTDKTKLELELGLLDSRFSSSGDGKLKGDEKVLKRLEASVSHRFGDRFVLSGAYESEQVYFFAKAPAGGFEMENVFIDAFKLGFAYDLVATESWTFTPAVAVATLLPAKTSSVDPKSGYAVEGSATLAYTLSQSLQVEGGLGYKLRSQDSSYSSQTQEQIGISLGLRYRL